MIAKAEVWGNKPDAHDYPAAEDFLGLIFPPPQAKQIVEGLHSAPIVHRKAKDILRASGLGVLDDTNIHVRKDLEKVKAGEPLSPVLLVRGDAWRGRPLIIADGYHRVCASWRLNEDADIPCQIANAPKKPTD